MCAFRIGGIASRLPCNARTIEYRAGGVSRGPEILPRYTVCMLEYEISPEPTRRILLREKKTRLIDVREPWEYSTAHIEPSTLMPMGDVPARAHQELDPDEHL